jgi:hypothetical protein
MKQAEQVAMNYAAQAERALRSTAENSAGPGKKYLRKLADRIKSAVHFQVPFGGTFFETETRIDYWGDAFARLPYGEITIEYDSDPEHGYDKFVTHAYESHDEKTGQHQIVTVSIGHSIDGGWTLFPVEALIRGELLSECLLGPRIASGFAGPNVSGDEALRLQLHFVTLAGGTVMEFLAALSCSNVSETTLPRPNPLSIAGRQATKGRVPLYETKVLTIAPVEAPATSARGGTHNSPRAHLRRGHIRRLASGKSVWVNATVVGKKELGLIYKSYNVAEMPTPKGD